MKLVNNNIIAFLIKCILFLTLYNYSYSQEDEPTLDPDTIQINKEMYEHLPGIKIKNKDELKKITDESDQTFLAYYYIKESKNSFVIANFLVGVFKKIEYLAGVLTIDCDEEEAKSFSQCQEENQEVFPKIYAMIPPQFKVNPYTRKVAEYSEVRFSEPNVSEKILYGFISKLIQGKGIKLNNDNHKAITSNPNFNKVLLFTDKP